MSQSSTRSTRRPVITRLRYGRIPGFGARRLFSWRFRASRWSSSDLSPSTTTGRRSSSALLIPSLLLRMFIGLCPLPRSVRLAAAITIVGLFLALGAAAGQPEGQRVDFTRSSSSWRERRSAFGRAWHRRRRGLRRPSQHHRTLDFRPEVAGPGASPWPSAAPCSTGSPLDRSTPRWIGPGIALPKVRRRR